ncbi:MAG: dCTP deaminase, partial [Nanoarchaeota archaeon]
MTQGWPENAYGCAAIQNEIAKEIGVECGIMTIISGSAQIYNNYYQQVEQMLQNYSENLLNCNDKKGNYQIKVQNNEIILNLLHPENGKVLEEIKGNSAYEIKDKISIHGLETGHAIYLGTELAMAEMAIKKEIDYEQDETIRRLGEIENKEKELVFNSERKISKKDASGILTDKKINEKIMSGEISINPFNKKCVQPVSYDLHLGNEFKLFKNYACEIIDTKKSVSGMMETIKLEEGQPFILHPKSFALALIKEKVGVNSRHVGRLEGKSSLARLGLVIHATAGHLNPGHCLNLTLELFNASSLPIKIYPGMEIAQIMFETLNEPCEKSYGDEGLNNKYMDNESISESKAYKNFK